MVCYDFSIVLNRCFCFPQNGYVLHIDYVAYLLRERYEAINLKKYNKKPQLLDSIEDAQAKLHSIEKKRAGNSSEEQRPKKKPKADPDDSDKSVVEIDSDEDADDDFPAAHAKPSAAAAAASTSVKSEKKGKKKSKDDMEDVEAAPDSPPRKSTKLSAANASKKSTSKQPTIESDTAMDTDENESAAAAAEAEAARVVSSYHIKCARDRAIARLRRRSRHWSSNGSDPGDKGECERKELAQCGSSRDDALFIRHPRYLLAVASRTKLTRSYSSEYVTLCNNSERRRLLQILAAEPERKRIIQLMHEHMQRTSAFAATTLD